MRGKRYMLPILGLAIFLIGMLVVGNATEKEKPMNTTDAGVLANGSETVEIATLAGGCFWCVESDMEKLPGVIKAVSGYAGGDEVAPSYDLVASGNTGHREAVQVHFDPSVVSYREILDHYWKHFDPTDDGGSFGDRGFQYTSAIFYHSDEQRQIAEESREALESSGHLDKPVVTPVIPFTTFYEAEKYHQDYYRKNPARYKSYRFFSGRDRYVKETWGEEAKVKSGSAAAPDDSSFVKPDDETLKQQLTPMQYKVTQHEGTEPAFDNAYWDNKAEGIYVDIVSGEPLFSSIDKFESGTGWPSFTRPLVSDNIVEKQDRTLFMVRTEVRSRQADSHLGHVFEDGPEPTGLRYCINSAALRFVPRSELEEHGYGRFEELFK